MMIVSDIEVNHGDENIQSTIEHSCPSGSAQEWLGRLAL